MTEQAYSYDFRGMNDATTPHRERIATFLPAYVGRHEHGHLWAAAPDLMRALVDATALLEVYTAPAGKHGPNATTRGQATATIKEARAAIAKAKGA